MEFDWPLVSGDSHLEIDSKWWVERVPAAHRERAPRLVRLPDGGDGWLIEGCPVHEMPSNLYGGKGRESWRPFGQTYEGTAGTGSASQRLAEQDKDGIAAEVLFPGTSGPKLWRNIRDDVAYLAVVRAYNDFLALDYCATDPERLLGVGIIPQTGVADAVAELTRCKELGLAAVLLSRFPNGGGRPTREDDAFWAAALDLAMPVTAHAEIDRSGITTLVEYPGAKEGVLADIARSAQYHHHTLFAEGLVKMARPAGANAVQLVCSGVFDRFPDLEIFFAETQIGWIPLFLEVADQRYERHVGWATELLGFEPLRDGLPSDYVKRHCLFGFQQDTVGVEMRHHLATEHLVWATDFPHNESEWPHSREVLEANFAGVPTTEARAMTADNVLRFLGRLSSA